MNNTSVPHELGTGRTKGKAVVVKSRELVYHPIIASWTLDPASSGSSMCYGVRTGVGRVIPSTASIISSTCGRAAFSKFAA